MNLIALRNFRNNHELEIEGAIHEKHVHKGAIFSVGGKKEFKDLTKAEQRIVIELNQSECIGDANNTTLVKRIEAEVKAEKAAEAKAAATAIAAGSSEDTIKRLIEALKGVQPTKA